MIKENLAAIHKRAAGATLIAVSKTFGVECVREALDAGQRVFGENRVQEAKSKFADLRAEYSDIELHMIGALQSNKAVDAVELFDVIQTLDRPSLAEALAKAVIKTGRHPRLYMEINIGEEPQKAGIAPDKAEDFLNYCRGIGLQVSGLMCIPPQDKDPTPFFLRMRELKDGLSLPHLSMGMSADFEAAINCGATEVRVGSAIFGSRII